MFDGMGKCVELINVAKLILQFQTRTLASPFPYKKVSFNPRVLSRLLQYDCYE